jgi:hypothetical protein
MMTRLVLSCGGVFVVVLAVNSEILAATPVDIFQDMDSGNDGDALTSTIMNASSHGGGSTWTVERGNLWVSTHYHRDLPGPVIVNGTTYSGTGGTRSWTVNDSHANNYVVGTLAGNYSKLTIACHYTPGATKVLPYNSFDHIVVLGDGVFMCMGLVYQGGAHGVGLYLEVESCVANYKSTDSPPITPIVAGKTYWINMHFDGPAGVSYLAVYDAENGYAQVGSTVQTASLKNSTLGRGVRIGRADSHGNNLDSTARTYFDNILIDYTNAAFPLLPSSDRKGKDKRADEAKVEESL